jgi:hypothetical protein
VLMRGVATVLDADPVLSIAAFSYTKVAAVATGNADLKFRATAGRLYRIRRNPDDVCRTISGWRRGIVRDGDDGRLSKLSRV